MPWTSLLPLSLGWRPLSIGSDSDRSDGWRKRLRHTSVVHDMPVNPDAVGAGVAHRVAVIAGSRQAVGLEHNGVRSPVLILAQAPLCLVPARERHVVHGLHGRSSSITLGMTVPGLQLRRRGRRSGSRGDSGRRWHDASLIPSTNGLLSVRPGIEGHSRFRPHSPARASPLPDP